MVFLAFQDMHYSSAVMVFNVGLSSLPDSGRQREEVRIM